MAVTKIIQLKPDEKVIIIYRRYGWTYIGPMVVTIVLLLIPFFLLTLLFAWGWWGIAAFVVILVIAVWYGLRKAITWYYNACIITSQRVVDIDQRGFFDRTVSELPHTKVQDVSYRVKGLLGTLFRVGTVTIQALPGLPKIELRRMKHPMQIADLLTQLREMK